MILPGLMLEVGFTAGPTTADYLFLGDATRGKLGTGKLAPVGLLTDITAFLHDARTQRKSSRLAGPLVRYEAGQLEATLNNTDRRFDPTNLSGPYVAAGITQVEPMRVTRLRASWAGVTYDVWRGFADQWLPGYFKGDDYSDCSLTAFDGFDVLANQDRPAVAPVGAGESSGARVNRILDSVSWPAADRMVSNGDTTLQATTLEGDAVSELQKVAETEVGEFYIDEGGRALFRGRHGLLEDIRSNTSQGIFGDDVGELPYVDINPSYDKEQLRNVARITRVGGVEQVASDATSKVKYLERTHTASDLLMQTDAAALDYARYIVAQAKSAEYRFDSLTINPAADDNAASLYPHALGRRIGDRITVRRRPPGGGLIERDVFIVGISHDIAVRPEKRWLTTWQLQSATKTAFLVLGHPTLGKLGQNALAY